MGCGNSKLNPEGGLVPPRIRPLLVRSRLSEFKKRKNGTNLRDGGALSKKVLLKDRDLEEENLMLVDNRKSMSCSPNTTPNSLPSQQHSTKQDKNDEEEANKVADQSNHRLEEEQPLPHHPDDLKHYETRLELKQDKTMDQHKYIAQGHENKKAGDEAKSDNNQENRCFICPGSPSFRVYFVEETKNVDAGIEDASHKKSPSHDSTESTTCAKFGEGQENKMIKNGKKGNTFNRVISKKRPVGVGVGVKNLLNVKSCYHLSCSGNDRANFLARKAEA